MTGKVIKHVQVGEAGTLTPPMARLALPGGRVKAAAACG